MLIKLLIIQIVSASLRMFHLSTQMEEYAIASIYVYCEYINGAGHDLVLIVSIWNFILYDLKYDTLPNIFMSYSF